MIHILLMILKIIGIVLLSIIVVVLLAVLAILFVPVRYRASSDYHGRFKGKIHVGWLLNIVRVDVSYEKRASIRAKALFFTLYDNSRSNNADDSDKQNDSDKKILKKNLEHQKEKNVFDENAEENVYTADVASTEAGNVDIHDKKNIMIDENKQPDDEVQSEKRHQLQYEQKLQKEHEPEQEHKVQHKKKAFRNEKKQYGAKKQRSFGSWFLTLTDKIKGVLEKIKIKAGNVVKNKNKLEAKIAEIKAMVEDEANKEMVSLLYDQFKVFLCEIKPVRYDINIHYGCEDPYITGKILVYASIFYGLSGLDVNIKPDFDNKIIEGDIFIKGRIRIYKLLLIGLRVYRNDRFKKLVLKR